VIRDSFVRSFDDSIAIAACGRGETAEPAPVRRVDGGAVRGLERLGRALEIGRTVAPRSRHVRSGDCDIVRTDYAAMDIQHGDRAAVRNIRYENIRLEIDDVNYPPTIQETDEAVFKAPGDGARAAAW
jgi:hypothetical protein